MTAVDVPESKENKTFLSLKRWEVVALVVAIFAMLPLNLIVEVSDDWRRILQAILVSVAVIGVTAAVMIRGRARRETLLRLEKEAVRTKNMAAEAIKKAEILMELEEQERTTPPRSASKKHRA